MGEVQLHTYYTHVHRFGANSSAVAPSTEILRGRREGEREREREREGVIERERERAGADLGVCNPVF